MGRRKNRKQDINSIIRAIIRLQDTVVNPDVLWRLERTIDILSEINDFGRRRTSTKLRQRVLIAYRNGIKIKDIKKIYGVSRSFINTLRKRAGLARYNYPPDHTERRAPATHLPGVPE